MQPLHRVTFFTAIALAAQAGEVPASAAPVTPAPESSGWEFTGSLYAPRIGLEGDIGVGALATSVDLSFGDILEEPDVGATAAFEARQDRWSITGDFIWLKLSAFGQPTAGARFRGDYGGFEVSSDEYWQLIAGIAY